MMGSFNLNISGMTFAVSCVCETTKDYCKEYLSQNPGEHPILISQADIEFERNKLSTVGGKICHISDNNLETVALQRKIADYITDHNRMLMHGSAICVDGKAYIFTAPSGTGKSTHTALLRKLLGDRCSMINDDKPFLLFDDDSIFACGTPWMGKHRLGSNMMNPLAGIFFLERSPENRLQIISEDAAVSKLFPQIHKPYRADRLEKTFDMFERLIRDVPMYAFGCNTDMSAAELSSSVMK